MKLDLFLQKTSNLYAENRLLKFVVLVFGIAVIVNSFFSYKALHYQKIVILPPVVDRRVVISGNDANEDYVKLFARYSMGLLENYTPVSVRAQFDELLKLVTPSFYPSFESTLADLETTVKTLMITSAFYPFRITLNKKDKTITVSGTRKQFTGSSIVDQGQSKTYKIGYIISNGRFFINDFKEIETK